MAKKPINNHDEKPEESFSRPDEIDQNENDVPQESSNALNEIETVRAELDEAKDQLLRVAADFENYKRQAVRREVESKERAVKNILIDLLPVVDNFDRAVHASSATQDVQNLRVGVEFILQQLHEVLRSYGVEPIVAEGKPFDPQQHEAVEEVPSDQHESGTVIEETQRGYNYKGQVLRPSMVKVASENSDQNE